MGSLWPHIPVVIATGYADVLDNKLDLRLLQKSWQQRHLAEPARNAYEAAGKRNG